MVEHMLTRKQLSQVVPVPKSEYARQKSKKRQTRATARVQNKAQKKAAWSAHHTPATAVKNDYDKENENNSI